RRTAEFEVPEMDCPSCAGKVENALTGVQGVLEHDLYPATQKAVVTYDPKSISADEVESTMESSGYSVKSSEEDDNEGVAGERESIWTSSRAVKTWISGVAVALGLVFEFVLTDHMLVATVGSSRIFVADILFLVGVGAAGQVIFRNGYYSLRNLSLDIDLLMSVAITGAVVASLVFGESFY
ncbi:MAG: cation transporter, partial [Halobacteria archaeon]|nr:cation transporter [Halobacteria archaeon]